MVLIMSVNPGYGGQKFIPYTLKKVKTLKGILQKRELDHVLIEIDGGITAENIYDAAEAGVDVFVAGSSVFGMDDYGIAISKLRESI
jgi:ribulose-phosphate 3-epimerase